MPQGGEEAEHKSAKRALVRVIEITATTYQER